MANKQPSIMYRIMASWTANQTKVGFEILSDKLQTIILATNITFI